MSTSAARAVSSKGFEVIPVDGVVSADAVVDTNTLSGEPLPVPLSHGTGIDPGVPAHIFERFYAPLHLTT